MIIAGLIGIRQLPAERLHLYEKEWFAQDLIFVQNSVKRERPDELVEGEDDDSS